MQTFTTTTHIISNGRRIASFDLNATFTLDDAYGMACKFIADNLDPEGEYDIEIQQVNPTEWED